MTTSMSVEIVQYFNGEERRIHRLARTASGARRALRECGSGAGWGVKLRGTRAALVGLGAITTTDCVLFKVIPGQEMFVDCIVTDATAKADSATQAPANATVAPTVEWTGPYRDQRAVLPDGRVARVWFGDPQWKCSIGEKKVCPRGVSYHSRDEARDAVLADADIAAKVQAARDQNADRAVVTT